MGCVTKEEWERLANLVAAAGGRPGMYTGDTDSLLAFNAFLTGVFSAAAPPLLREFNDHVEARFGTGPFSGFGMIAWTKRQEAPEIMDRELISEVGEYASAFLREKAGKEFFQ
ncbi:hypothetical protein KBY28_02015 [Ruegeria pomeroyi]|uniref:hypothetical protein n=1 Tax=Ruegeria pomeroyi TaxID=89184 RepID=UPI001F3B292C|nr:hypothetical protein [Ruegeria pomeroyi]MCE8507215.1 hypothetical protein [Ruegeria pomeroyi]